MLFEYSYNIADLLYDDYLLYKTGLNENQIEVMKKRIISVMSPLYSHFGYIMEQLLSEEFLANEWEKVSVIFTGCSFHARSKKWEIGSFEERLYFRERVDDMLNTVIAFLREQEENDIETAMVRHVVYYQDVDFVVWHELLKKDAYRLHSCCYDMKFNPEASYEQIKEDPYQDVFDYHFYCRTEPSRTQVSFRADWLEEWDAERFERVQMLIEKMPGAYNQYFHPSVN